MKSAKKELQYIQKFLSYTFKLFIKKEVLKLPKDYWLDHCVSFLLFYDGPEQLKEELLLGLETLYSELKKGNSRQFIKSIQDTIDKEDIDIHEYLKKVSILTVPVSFEDIEEIEKRNESIMNISKMFIEKVEQNFEVGDYVMIPYPLLTNMLVSANGEQVGKEDFSVPSLPSLANKKAMVTQVKSKKFNYLCAGCDNKHIADIKIDFPETKESYYISKHFLTHYTNEDEK